MNKEKKKTHVIRISAETFDEIEKLRVELGKKHWYEVVDWMVELARESGQPQKRKKR